MLSMACLEIPRGGLQKMLKAQGLKDVSSNLKVFALDIVSAIGMCFRAKN
jgi:hypothetical protein